MRGKKGVGILLKIIMFVVVIFVVVAAFWSLFSSGKKTALALAKKPLEQYNVQEGSFIHPNLNIENYNFWEYQFINFVKTGATTQTGDFCYGTFYTLPGFDMLDKWTLTFLSQDNSLFISLKDSRGILAASYQPTEEYPELKDIKLCFETPGGKQIDVHDIVIEFGKEKAYYDSLDNKKVEFYYQAYPKDTNSYRKDKTLLDILNKDETKSNLFFFTYHPAKGDSPRRLCITPVEKNGKENSMSYDKIKDLFAKNGFPEYKIFCDMPKLRETAKDELEKFCFYTSCDTYSLNNLKKSGRITNEYALTETDQKKPEETKCGMFSIDCGKICTRTYPFGTCEPCAKYRYCSDYNARVICENAQIMCGMQCKWDIKENECVVV